MQKWILALSVVAAVIAYGVFNTSKAKVSPLWGAESISLSGHGSVKQVLKAGRYTYFQLENQQWHVTTSQSPQKGHRLEFKSYAKLAHFHSSSLDRNFSPLFFTSINAPQNLPVQKKEVHSHE